MSPLLKLVWDRACKGRLIGYFTDRIQVFYIHELKALSELFGAVGKVGFKGLLLRNEAQALSDVVCLERLNLPPPETLEQILNPRQTYRLAGSLALGMPVALIIMGSGNAHALPTGYQGVQGGISFSQSGNVLNVNTTTQRAIANYQTFNVAAGETVNFNLPNSASAILNRVIGGTSSSIFGNINSNGQVFLINPSGILFEKTAQVNVGSLFASTLNISDPDFMAGKYVFQKDANASPASIINLGNIQIQKNGAAVLLASAIDNQGTINVPNGQLHLAVGDQITVSTDDSGIVMDVTVNTALKQKVDALQAAISNSGTLRADAGLIKLQAYLSSYIQQQAINNSGIVEAHGFNTQKGSVEFTADPNTNNTAQQVVNSGTVDVSSGDVQTQGGSVLLDGSLVEQLGTVEAKSTVGLQKGGQIHLLGNDVALGSDSVTDVSGDGGGGEVLVGGNFHGSDDIYTAQRTYISEGANIKADALTSGDGGKIVIWSDDTTWDYGTISAKGGTQDGSGGEVETSGKGILIENGTVDTSAAKGHEGTWLLDPTTINIVSSGADTTDLTTVDQFSDPNLNGSQTSIAVSAINNSTSDVTLQATQDININADINITHAQVDLSAQANRNINIASNIVTNNGNVSFTANNGISVGGNINVGNGQIILTAGNANLTNNGIVTNGNYTLSGNTFSLLSGSGPIGSANHPLFLAGNNLSVNSTNSSNQYITATTDITLRDAYSGAYINEQTLNLSTINNKNITVGGTIGGYFSNINLYATGSGNIVYSSGAAGNFFSTVNLHTDTGNIGTSNNPINIGDYPTVSVTSGGNAYLTSNDSYEFLLNPSTVGNGKTLSISCGGDYFYFTGNIAAPSGTINIYTSGGITNNGNAFLSAGNVSLYSSQYSSYYGGIGSSGSPISINANNLSVGSAYNNIYIASTGNVQLTGLSLSSSNSLNLMTQNNGNISIGGNISGGSINLTANNTGSIIDVTGGLISGNYLDLASGVGNIGSPTNPILTSIGNLSAATGGTGGINISQSGALNLLASSSGGNFEVQNNDITQVVGQISAGGNLNLITTGTLNLDQSSAANTLTAQNVFLQAPNINIQNAATVISATGSGGTLYTYDDDAGSPSPSITPGMTITPGSGGTGGLISVNGDFASVGTLRSTPGGAAISINYTQSNLDLTNVTINQPITASNGVITITNDTSGNANNGTLQTANGSAGSVTITTANGYNVTGTGTSVTAANLNIASAGNVSLTGSFNNATLTGNAAGSFFVTETASNLNVGSIAASGTASLTSQSGNIILTNTLTGGVNAQEVDLNAINGSIGSNDKHFKTNSSSLSIKTATTGNAFVEVSGPGDITLKDSSFGGGVINLNLTGNSNISVGSNFIGTSDTMNINFPGAGNLVDTNGSILGAGNLNIVLNGGNIGSYYSSIYLAVNNFATDYSTYTDYKNAYLYAVKDITLKSSGAHVNYYTINLQTANNSNITLDGNISNSDTLNLTANGSGNIVYVSGGIGGYYGSVYLQSGTGDIGSTLNPVQIGDYTYTRTTTGGNTYLEGQNPSVIELAGSTVGTGKTFSYIDTSLTNAALTIYGNITAPSGTINILTTASNFATSGNIFFNANTLNLSATGSNGTGIGTSASPISTNATVISVNTGNAGGNVYLTDQTGFQLNASSVGANSVMTLNTGNNGGISLGGNITGGTLNLNSVGTGDITDAIGGQIAGNFVNLTSGSGNIGSSLNPILTKATSLSAATSGTGNINISQTGSLNLVAGSAGGDFNLHSNNTIQLMGGVSSNGNLSLTTSGTLNLDQFNTANIVTGQNVFLAAGNVNIQNAASRVIATGSGGTLYLYDDNSGTPAPSVTPGMTIAPTIGGTGGLISIDGNFASNGTLSANPGGAAISIDYTQSNLNLTNVTINQPTTVANGVITITNDTSGLSNNGTLQTASGSAGSVVITTANGYNVTGTGVNVTAGGLNIYSSGNVSLTGNFHQATITGNTAGNFGFTENTSNLMIGSVGAGSTASLIAQTGNIYLTNALTGKVNATEVDLTASNGSIGTNNIHMNTNANTLKLLTNSTGNAYVDESSTGNITLGNSSIGGGAITITSTGTNNITIGGNFLGSSDALSIFGSGSGTIVDSSGYILGADTLRITANGNIGTSANPLLTSVNSFALQVLSNNIYEYITQNKDVTITDSLLNQKSSYFSFATTNNANITLAGNIGSGDSITLSAGGTGNIIYSSGTLGYLGSSGSFIFKSDSGNIGTAINPIPINYEVGSAAVSIGGVSGGSAYITTAYSTGYSYLGVSPSTVTSGGTLFISNTNQDSEIAIGGNLLAPNGTIILKSNSIYLPNGVNLSANNVQFEPGHNSAISFGTSGFVTTVELNQITAQNVTIGSTTIGGGLTVAGNVNLYTYNLYLENAGDITGSNVALNKGTNILSLQSGGNINISNAIDHEQINLTDTLAPSGNVTLQTAGNLSPINIAGNVVALSANISTTGDNSGISIGGNISGVSNIDFITHGQASDISIFNNIFVTNANFITDNSNILVNGNLTVNSYGNVALIAGNSGLNSAENVSLTGNLAFIDNTASITIDTGTNSIFSSTLLSQPLSLKNISFATRADNQPLAFSSNITASHDLALITNGNSSAISVGNVTAGDHLSLYTKYSDITVGSVNNSGGYTDLTAGGDGLNPNANITVGTLSQSNFLKISDGSNTIFNNSFFNQDLVFNDGFIFRTYANNAPISLSGNISAVLNLASVGLPGENNVFLPSASGTADMAGISTSGNDSPINVNGLNITYHFTDDVHNANQGTIINTFTQSALISTSGSNSPINLVGDTVISATYNTVVSGNAPVNVVNILGVAPQWKTLGSNSNINITGDTTESYRNLDSSEPHVLSLQTIIDGSEQVIATGANSTTDFVGNINNFVIGTSLAGTETITDVTSPVFSADGDIHYSGNMSINGILTANSANGSIYLDKLSQPSTIITGGADITSQSDNYIYVQNAQTLFEAYGPTSVTYFNDVTNPIVPGTSYGRQGGIINLYGQLVNAGHIYTVSGGDIYVSYVNNDLDLTNVGLYANGLGAINLTGDTDASNNGDLQTLAGTGLGKIIIDTLNGHNIVGSSTQIEGTVATIISTGNLSLSGDFGQIPLSLAAAGNLSLSQTASGNLNITSASTGASLNLETDQDNSAIIVSQGLAMVDSATSSSITTQGINSGILINGDVTDNGNNGSGLTISTQGTNSPISIAGALNDMDLARQSTNLLAITTSSDQSGITIGGNITSNGFTNISTQGQNSSISINGNVTNTYYEINSCESDYPLTLYTSGTNSGIIVNGAITTNYENPTNQYYSSDSMTVSTSNNNSPIIVTNGITANVDNPSQYGCSNYIYEYISTSGSSSGITIGGNVNTNSISDPSNQTYVYSYVVSNGFNSPINIDGQVNLQTSGGFNTYTQSANSSISILGNITSSNGYYNNVSAYTYQDNSNIFINGNIANSQNQIYIYSYGQNSGIVINGDMDASVISAYTNGNNSSMSISGNINTSDEYSSTNIYTQGTNSSLTLGGNVTDNSYYGYGLNIYTQGTNSNLSVAGSVSNTVLNGNSSGNENVDISTTGDYSNLSLNNAITSSHNITLSTNGQNSNLVLGPNTINFNDTDGTTLTTQGSSSSIIANGNLVEAGSSLTVSAAGQNNAAIQLNGSVSSDSSPLTISTTGSGDGNSILVNSITTSGNILLSTAGTYSNIMQLSGEISTPILAISTGASDIGSPAQYVHTVVDSISIGSGGSVYLEQGNQAIQITEATVANNLNVSVGQTLTNTGLISAGSVNLVTTANNGNINVNNNITGDSGINLLTQGLGDVYVSSTEAVTAHNSSLVITTHQLNLAPTSLLVAGSGSVSIIPNSAMPITVNDNGSASGFDISTTQLGQISAGSVIIGSINTPGGITVANDLDLNSLGYNMTLANQGNITSINHLFNLGSYQLNMSSGGNINLSTIGDNRDINTSSLFATGHIAISTQGNNANINLAGNTEGESGVTLTTSGSNANVTLANNVTLSAQDNTIAVTASSLSTGNNDIIHAGNGTIDLNPNTNGVITIADNDTANGFNISAGTLADLEARQVSIGSSLISGNVDVLGNINLNVLNYDLSIADAGNLTAQNAMLESGAHNLSLYLGGNIAISNLGIGQSVQLTNVISNGAIRITTAGDNSAIAFNGNVSSPFLIDLETKSLNSDITNTNGSMITPILNLVAQSGNGNITTQITNVSANLSGNLTLNNQGNLNILPLGLTAYNIALSNLGDINTYGTISGRNVLLTASGSLLGHTALDLQATQGASVTSKTIGTRNTPFNVNISGGLLNLTLTGQVDNISGNINGFVSPSNTLTLLKYPSGQVLFNALTLYPLATQPILQYGSLFAFSDAFDRPASSFHENREISEAWIDLYSNKLVAPILVSSLEEMVNGQSELVISYIEPTPKALKNSTSVQLNKVIPVNLTPEDEVNEIMP